MVKNQIFKKLYKIEEQFFVLFPLAIKVLITFDAEIMKNKKSYILTITSFFNKNSKEREILIKFESIKKFHLGNVFIYINIKE